MSRGAHRSVSSRALGTAGERRGLLGIVGVGTGEQRGLLGTAGERRGLLGTVGVRIGEQRELLGTVGVRTG